MNQAIKLILYSDVLKENQPDTLHILYSIKGCCQRCLIMQGIFIIRKQINELNKNNERTV